MSPQTQESPQVLSHFEKGKEAGVGGGWGWGGAVPAREVSQELSPSQDTAGCTVARGGEGELWMDAKIFPTCRVGWHGGAKHHRF